MKTIIIVEDEFRTREGIERLIKKINNNLRVIATAEDGIEGIKKIRDLMPDIVFTDVRMPKMDGLTMIQRTNEMGIKVHYVIISGYADFAYAQRAISLGVRDYLLKPVTVLAVKEMLEKLENEEKKPMTDTGKYSELIKSIMQMVRTEYASAISLNQIAEKFRMTPQYISNLFTKETGKTFSAYLRDVRMAHAKKLLEHSDAKIYEVAVMVGYPDQKYFSKIFKEYTGISAKHYMMRFQIKK